MNEEGIKVSARSILVLTRFVSRNVSVNYLKIEEGHDLNSDHSPVYLILNSRITAEECKPVLCNKHTDWSYFRYILSADELSAPSNKSDIEEYAYQITSSIQNAAWRSTPELKKNFISKSYPYDVKNLLKEKRRLRRKWQRTRNPQHKTALNRATKELKRRINDFDNKSVEKYLSQLTNDKSTEYSLWKTTRKLKMPDPQSHPIKMENGN